MGIEASARQSMGGVMLVGSGVTASPCAQGSYSAPTLLPMLSIFVSINSNMQHTYYITVAIGAALCGALLLVGCPTNAAAPNDPADTTEPVGVEYTLAWSEEFDGASIDSAV